MSSDPSALTALQQTALVVLRTLVGWHFAYEGYFKLLRPAWTREGALLGHWSSAGYLRGAGGPFAETFHGLAASPWLSTIDWVVSVALLLVGFSLILGLFTQAGCVGALLLLGMFYVSAIPSRGVHEAGNEGAYLFVNKNLVEAAAVLALLAFRTGRIAGLDLWRGRPRARPRAEEAA